MYCIQWDPTSCSVGTVEVHQLETAIFKEQNSVKLIKQARNDYDAIHPDGPPKPIKSTAAICKLEETL